jgi:putative pyruvate formate lyase activating enzyme
MGFCKSSNKIKAARAALHFWEEPCISGSRGSGTIFFSGCTLRCCYCQNYCISSEGFGKEISIQRLAEICLELQEKGVHNINLVTATQYLDSVLTMNRLQKQYEPDESNSNAIDTTNYFSFTRRI